jgi:hypothetical protein
MIYILIVILTFLILVGLITKPKAHTNYINPSTSALNPLCMDTPTECLSAKECESCSDGVAMDCVELKRNPHQKKAYGNIHSKYCLPVKPDKPCTERLGGIWTWTGWASNRKEWDCLCTYPEIAGNIGCTRLNPNVCKDGVFAYDATTATRGPTPNDCQCYSGYTKIVTDTNVPLCIKKADGYCSDERVCRNFYSSSSKGNLNFLQNV